MKDKHLFSVLLLLCAVCLPTKGQLLSVRLDSLLTDTLLLDSEVGMAVYDLDEDTLLYSHQSAKLYRPASILKIATAITALDSLGALHPFTTSLWHTGSITPDSLLEGNLYVVGGFDPLFNHTDMEQFASAVRETGIRRVSGSLIGNVALKDSLQWGCGWCWDDDMPRLTPLLYERTDSFLPMLRHILGSYGVTVCDTTFSYTSSAPDTIIIQIASRERRLTQVLDRMMKKSDNLHAEAVFYQLAAARGKRPYATADDAVKTIHNLLKRIGLDPKRYLIADGSGVSLYNYLSPDMLLELLKYAYAHTSIYVPLCESLPLAGVDGTLKHRMKGTPAYRKVYAKTGTLTGVCSLAGYAQARNGHTLAFVIINQNILRLQAARAWQDRVCMELCR